MIATSNDNDSGRGLLLKMAFEAECLIALRQHTRVHRAVDLMTSGATLPHRLMFKDKRAALRRVAFAAGVAFPRGISESAMDGIALMWMVAIRA